MAAPENERYPSGIPVTEADFLTCGWNPVISGLTRDDYASRWSALSAAARDAITADGHAKGKVLWLLADAASMALQPESRHEPFRPAANILGRRTAIPDDFDQEAIALFEQAYPHVDDLLLRARLADLLWLLKSPRNIQHALAAIDAYRQLPVTKESWLSDGRFCHERALRLAIGIGKAAGTRVQEMEDSLVTAFLGFAPDDGFMAFWVAELLRQVRLAATRATEIAEKLAQLGTAFDQAGDIHKSRQYFELAADWYGDAGDDLKSAAMMANIAESWVKGATERSSGPQPSFMAAASFYQQAIHAYRKIPGKQRNDHRADERIAELHRLLTDAGAKSMSEMRRIQTPTIDISQMVTAAQNAVSGKSMDEALLALGSITPGMRYAAVRDQAANLMKQSLLSGMAAATMLSKEGRVIAKRPAFASSGPTPPDDDPALMAETVKFAGIRMSLVVQGYIWPALEILSEQHRIRALDLLKFTSRSPIVPPDRAQLFAKGLQAGFENDFGIAIHVLAPQIEHAVRFQLQLRNVKTTTLDGEGIENEIGLSALMEKPEVGNIFGPDLCFEIKAIFTDAFGPNLRNEVAHGLLNDGQGMTVSAIYAWWWVLSLVLSAFTQAVTKQQ